MLLTLRIRDLVIIDDVTVEFGPGLNLLTGETGAGKSILVDALGLILGDRADRGLVRAGSERAVVEAVFEPPADSAAREWARAHGLDEVACEETWVLRRELPRNGSARVFVNGSPFTLGMLRELGARLLESHGQHEQHDLLAPERHLELLDRYGGNRARLAELETAYGAVVAAEARLEELEQRAGERSRLREGLEQTIREIEDVDPSPGEIDEIDRKRRLLRNAGRVTALLDELVALTYDGDRSAGSIVAQAATKAGELAEIDAGLEELAARLRGATVEIEDIGAAYRDMRQRADFDPRNLDALEERRLALERLLLRYGENETAVLERAQEARVELGELAGVEEDLLEARREVRRAEETYATRAGKLTRARRKASRALVPAVASQLSRLALQQARLEVGFEAARGRPVGEGENPRVPLHPRGAERAVFRLAANPGEPPRELHRVASGGELSRVMLALHAVIRDSGNGRVLVFDEVDAGVGGAVADAVGARLAGLAQEHQVLCVTHLPQVAAYANRHFRVAKRVEGKRTRAEVVGLGQGDRVDELARMLAGREPTAASRRHASELIRAAGRAAVEPE